MVAQVDQVELHVAPLLGDVVDPLPGLVAKASGAVGGKDDGDFGLASPAISLSKRLKPHGFNALNWVAHKRGAKEAS